VKIDKPSKPLPMGSAGETPAHATAKGKSGQPSSSQPASSTNVSLGSTAAQLNSMESSMGSMPVVDAGKVAEIKQAISDGRFKVNAGVVADRLIETVRELAARGK